MYQLHNLINCTFVPSDPSNNMITTEDFFIATFAYTLWLQQKLFSLSTLSVQFQTLSMHLLSMLYTSHKPAQHKHQLHVKMVFIYVYAVELLTLSLLWHGFHDAFRKGDVQRILRYLRFLLVVFKSSNYPNHAKGAVRILLQYYYLFSEGQKAQLLWSHCINTKAHPGANVPNDLHMEHLNWRLKIVLRGLEANSTPNSSSKGWVFCCSAASMQLF